MDKQPTLDIESAISAVILLEGDIYMTAIVSAGIKQEYFQNQSNADIFKASCDYHAINGRYPDYIALSDYMTANKYQIGNYVGYSDLYISSSKLQEWIRAFLIGVKRVLKLRGYRLLGLADKTHSSEDLKALEVKAEALIQEAELIQIDTVDVLAGCFQRLNEEYSQLERGIIPKTVFDWDISDIMNKIGGLKGHEMVVIAARPGIGKTSFLTQSILSNIQTGKKGIIFSLEMSEDEIIKRMICQNAIVDYSILSLKPQALQKYKRSLDELTPIIKERLVVSSNSNVKSMSGIISKQIQNSRVDFIAVDYIQLCTGGDLRQNRTNQVSEITRTMKLWTSEFKIPVLALSQLNRSNESESRKPRLSDLRESGSIEQDADVVFILHMPVNNSQGIPQEQELIKEVNVNIAKNRSGCTGSCDVMFKPNYTRFFNLEKHENSY
jgi:replicative DNA helicase